VRPVLHAGIRQILLFERWYQQRLAPSDPQHARILRAFATWRLLRELHRKAARGQLTPGSRNTAVTRLITAGEFLTWLGARAAASTRPARPTSTRGTPGAAARDASAHS
jgi:hypothetical protein